MDTVCHFNQQIQTVIVECGGETGGESFLRFFLIHGSIFICLHPGQISRIGYIHLLIENSAGAVASVD